MAFKVKTVGTYDPKIKRFRTPSPWYRKGVSDIVCCYQGKFIGLEVKTSIGKLSIHQEAFARDIIKAGGIYAIVRSLEDVEKLFWDLVNA